MCSLEWIRAGSPHKVRLPPVTSNDGRAQDVLGGRGHDLSENLIILEDDKDEEGRVTIEEKRLSTVM